MNLNKPFEVTQLVFKGLGLARQDNQSIFIPNSLPGDQIILSRIYKKKGVKFGIIEKIVTPSPLRITAPCNHFNHCGGCQLLNVSYPNQLHLKNEILSDLINQLYPSIPKRPEPIIACDNHTYYRNKMEFSFGTKNNVVFAGLKKRGSFHEIIRVSDCLLQSKQTPIILKIISTYFTQKKTSTWDYFKHTGILRHVTIRESKGSNQLLLIFSVSSCIKSLISELSHHLTQEIPEISGILQTINDNPSDTAFPNDITVIYGSDTLQESLHDKAFIISPQSFFQTNTQQATILFEKAILLANLKKTDICLDLYCGTGTIGILIADHVKKVIGIEEVPEAIINAKKNAEKNNINNIEFHTGRVKNLLKFNQYNPSVIIVDPPRSGIVPKALTRIINQNASKIIYISCNPSTLLRDLNEFIKANYRISHFVPVDMFPHTYHIECIVIMEK